MYDRRYDLQALIYSLALHRYLAQRIADYDYATPLRRLLLPVSARFAAGQRTGIRRALRAHRRGAAGGAGTTCLAFRRGGVAMKRVLMATCPARRNRWHSLYFGDYRAAERFEDIDDVTPLTAALVSEANQQGHVVSICAIRAPVRRCLTARMIEPGSLPARRPWTSGARACWPARGRRPRRARAADPRRRAPVFESLLALRNHGGREAGRYGRERYRDEIVDLPPSVFEASDARSGPAHAIELPRKIGFCVISGGPGSGKTSTVIRILALLTRQNPDYRIALAAPTGKAAARMMDSIRDGLPSAEATST